LIAPLFGRIAISRRVPTLSQCSDTKMVARLAMHELLLPARTMCEGFHHR
jgi:hypothetical protein